MVKRDRVSLVHKTVHVEKLRRKAIMISDAVHQAVPVYEERKDDKLWKLRKLLNPDVKVPPKKRKRMENPPTSPSHPTPVAKEEQQSRDLERFRREEKERIKREKKEQLSEDIERFRLADREREENEKNNNVKKYY
ncbi:hypothetical protein PRIPAC_88822 [Pristionchus pacificus]|uniref:Uncharacterized protein n=1 Tax=Pristionchus pacificus TaxID=54126 RepID=A0A2A6B9N6_PRIPA|nr:hypothetical protein PRIPAC_88822 [Pristionchus pacificus]|eukprot:PDM62571.1 hypothetical protein PRIPAC_52013 [Pristionchus pacificus]